MTRGELAKKIQFTNVYPDATKAKITEHCERCVYYGFDAAMIAPCWIKLGKDVLKGTGVRVATAIAFPNGNETSAIKAAMAAMVVADGADDLDFVPTTGFLLSGMEKEYFDDMKAVVEAAGGRPVKAMLEFGLLPTIELRRKAARYADEAGVHWVKQSSGWGKGGIPATVEDVRFLRENVSLRCKVKASGKINTLEKALAFLAAGAEMIGSSSAPAILEGMKQAGHTLEL